MKTSRRLHLRGLAVVATIVLTAACQGTGSDDASRVERPRGGDSTPVVLISIDTLRSDRLPAYGYTGVETPAIDALRADATRFDHAYTHVPLTLPSHTSMLTGRFPYEHGIHDNQGYTLDDAWVTLPEILGGRGYRSGAFVSSFILRAETGLEQGFEIYDDQISDAPANQLVSPLRPGRETLEAASAWLGEVASGPFFLFFHIYEPHLPYQPDEPFLSRYGANYDAEVATADAVIGGLLDRMRDLGIYDRAMIILTSDHGEGLGEHGLIEHGPLLYREVLQIPLIVKLPGAANANGTLDRPAQLVDLMPTVLKTLGIDGETADDATPLPGIDLFGADTATDDRMLYGETLFPRLHFGWSELYSLIDYPFHYIHGPDPELYNLETDPQELTNILSDQRRQYRAMADALADLPIGFTAPGPVDAETREQLAALGYIGSVASSGEDRERADPKSKLHVMRALSRAFDQFRNGDCEATIEGLEKVIAEEAEILEAWEYLGVCHLRRGNPAAALEAYEQTMKLTGGSPKAAVDTAAALLALGRRDEAEQHAKMAIPSQPTAYNLIAQVALLRDDLESAEAAIEKALEHPVARPNALMGKADVALARDQPEAALGFIEQATAIAVKPLKGVAFVRGKAFANLGRVEEATAAFTEAIEADPRETAPYTHLALLRGLVGDGEGAVTSLRALVSANPTPTAYAEAVETLRLLGDPDGAGRLLAYARGQWPDHPRLGEL